MILLFVSVVDDSCLSVLICCLSVLILLFVSVVLDDFVVVDGSVVVC